MIIVNETRYTVTDGKLTVAVTTDGAQIRSIRTSDGTEYIWSADPAWWPKSAPIMFPICGGLKDDRFTHNGKTYTLAKHGFTGREFAVESHTADTLTLFIKESADTLAMYPFHFIFRVTFAVKNGTLSVTYTTVNTGDETLYYADGGHEAYAAPEGIEAYDVVFEKEEDLTRQVLDGNLLEHKFEHVETDGKTLHMKYSHMDNDCLSFAATNSKAVTFTRRAGGRKVRITFDDFAHLVIWTKKGAPYLCIEPWNGCPDLVDADGVLAHKPSMFALAPGESLSHTHTVTPCAD